MFIIKVSFKSVNESYVAGYMAFSALTRTVGLRFIQLSLASFTAVIQNFYFQLGTDVMSDVAQQPLAFEVVSIVFDFCARQHIC